MPVVKWKLVDPYDDNPATNTYVFAVSPNEMTTPYPTRNITTMGTTAPDGKFLMWESAPSPAIMSFSGTILDRDQLLTLRSWVYDRNRRLHLTDHFNRQMTVVLHKFDAVPVRTTGRFYYRHTYTIECTVISVKTPLISNEGP